MRTGGGLDSDGGRFGRSGFQRVSFGGGRIGEQGFCGFGRGRSRVGGSGSIGRGGGCRAGFGRWRGWNGKCGEARGRGEAGDGRTAANGRRFVRVVGFGQHGVEKDTHDREDKKGDDRNEERDDLA